MQLDAERYRLEPALHRDIFERFIRPHLFTDVKASATPAAIVFGGQPGSGKSTAMATAVRELGGPAAAVAIVGDELRAYHPAYDRLMREDDRLAAFYTDRDSGAWVEMAIDVARALRVPLVIEGTMRSFETVARTLHLLRDSGYRTEARALAVPWVHSWQAIQLRYETQRLDRGSGRMTTAQAHQAAYDGLPVTLAHVESERLADRVTVYSRDGKRLYWHDLDREIKSEPTNARAVVEAFRAVPMSLPELRLFAAEYARLEALLAMADRQATPEELNAANELRTGAQRQLLAEAFRVLPERQALAEFPALQGAYAALKGVAGSLKSSPDSEITKMALKTAREQIARSLAGDAAAAPDAHRAVAQSTPASSAPLASRGRGR